MRKEAIKKFEETLLKRRRALQDALNHSEVQECQTVTADSISEGAQVSEQNEIALQLASVETRSLNDINVALDRIKSGTYGKCDGCGTDISLMRLSAIPFAVRCLKCQEVADNDPSSDNE